MSYRVHFTIPQGCKLACSKKCRKFLREIFESEVPRYIKTESGNIIIKDIDVELEDNDNEEIEVSCILSYKYDFSKEKWTGGPCRRMDFEKLFTLKEDTEAKIDKTDKNILWFPKEKIIEDICKGLCSVKNTSINIRLWVKGDTELIDMENVIFNNDENWISSKWNNNGDFINIRLYNTAW